MIECQKCHHLRPPSAFFKRRGVANGLQKWCKDCQSAALRAWRARRAAEARARPWSEILGNISGATLDVEFITDPAELVPDLGGPSK